MARPTPRDPALVEARRVVTPAERLLYGDFAAPMRSLGLAAAHMHTTTGLCADMVNEAEDIGHVTSDGVGPVWPAASRAFALLAEVHDALAEAHRDLAEIAIADIRRQERVRTADSQLTPAKS